MSFESSDRATTHAPIPQPRRRPFGRIAAPVLATVLVVTALYPATKTLTPATPVTIQPVLGANGPAPAMVNTLVPAQSASERVVQAPGWLEPDPYPIAVSALADSVVLTMHALEGERVEAGQVIAALNDEDAQLEVAVARANLGTAKSHALETEADLNAAQAHWDHPIEQDRALAAQEAQLIKAKAELAQWPSRTATAEANAERWRQEQQRTQRALEKQAASEQEAEIAAQQQRAAAASLQTIRLEEAVLKARIQELEAEVQAATRDLALRINEAQALAFAKGKHAESLAAVQVAEAQLEQASLKLERMTVRAPMSGYVLRRLKAPGDKVMLGMDDPHSAHLVHLYDPEKLQVRVDVPLADAALIRVGQACEVIVDVLPDTTFQGRVTRITHEADLQKNTLQVKVQVLDPGPVLRPEMLTRVRFLPKQYTETEATASITQTNGLASAGTATRIHVETTGALRVLAACVQEGTRVFAVRQREHGAGVAEAIAVKVLTEANGLTTVRGDLQPSDWLIENPSAIKDGQRVRYVQPEGGAA